MNIDGCSGADQSIQRAGRPRFDPARSGWCFTLSGVDLTTWHPN
jgi:replicative superfamily II helicase